jgi:hypothetical protein
MTAEEAEAYFAEKERWRQNSLQKFAADLEAKKAVAQSQDKVIEPKNSSDVHSVGSTSELKTISEGEIVPKTKKLFKDQSDRTNRDTSISKI